MKKITSSIMVVVLLLGMLIFNVSAQENVSVYMNGEKLEFDVQPQIINGRTMLPVRAVFEALGASVEWDESTQTVIATRKHYVTSNILTVKMTINSSSLLQSFSNGLEYRYNMDVPLICIDDRTLAPMRFVANSMGYVVCWSEAEKTAYIETPEESARGEYYTGTNIPTFDSVSFPNILSCGNIRIGSRDYEYVYDEDEIQIARNNLDNYLSIMENNGWTMSDKKAVSNDFYIYKYSKNGIDVKITVQLNMSWTWGVEHRINISFYE